MKKIYAALLCILLSSCGGGGDDPPCHPEHRKHAHVDSRPDVCKQCPNLCE